MFTPTTHARAVQVDGRWLFVFSEDGPSSSIEAGREGIANLSGGS